MRSILLSPKTLNVGVAAALLLSGTAAGAFAAQLQPNPIEVEHVQVMFRGPPEDGAGIPISVEIAFKNEYSAPATDVVFLVEEYGQVVDRINDVGSFAQGVVIRHTFPESKPDGNYHVVVGSATFADGTTWKNGAVNQY
jgi:hypothetical protein